MSSIFQKGRLDPNEHRQADPLKQGISDAPGVCRV
jgi:hypothetical protein